MKESLTHDNRIEKPLVNPSPGLPKNNTRGRHRGLPSYAAAAPAAQHSFGAFGGPFGGAQASPARERLAIAKSDYDAFERLLGEIQGAYSAEDLSALRATVTPEMLSYFSEQLAGNASRGLINRVSEVKLLKGDLRKLGAKA